MLNERHNELVSAYKAGTLECPEIRWHEQLSEIDLSLQPDKLHRKLLEENLSILPKVRLGKLVRWMSEADAAFFGRKKLYEYSSDQKTSRVLDLWQQGEKLIPPTILIYDQQYMNLVRPTGIPSSELRPADGKHRLAICCNFEVETIPILVLNRQLDLIKRVLKM